MANSAGVRQDKVRFFTAELESTVGAFELDPKTPSSTDTRIPARGESRLMPVDGDVIDNSEALDGYAGAIASTRGAVGMGGTLVTELRSNPDTVLFPTHVKQLLASGFECSAYSASAATLIPSTKAIAAWANDNREAKSPASMSIAECLIDNNTADEWAGVMGGVLATKINLGTNGIVTYESAITGQVPYFDGGDLFLDVGDTDLGSYGAEPTNQGVDPAVVKNATLAVKYTDDDSHTESVITPDRFRSLTIDLAPTITRIEDPTATNGFAVSPVFYDGAIGVTLEFADSSDYDNSVTAGTIMAGFKSQRGFLSIELTLELISTATYSVAQTIKYDLPRVQYDVERANAEGARAFTFTGRAVRPQRGSSDNMMAITYSHGTA